MPIKRDTTHDDLRRLHRVKTTDAPLAVPLGAEMIDFFKHAVTRRQNKLVKLAECWTSLVPPLLNEHCALESFSKGTLTVLVDSSSHLYELKTLLLKGLQQQLLIACKTAGLKKINLRPGRWYEGQHPGERKVRFHTGS